MLDGADLPTFLHHSLHPHTTAKREVLSEGDEDGSTKRKSHQTSSTEARPLCLIERGSDYVPVAFSTFPFVGMLLLYRKASAPIQGTIHLSLLFMIAPFWLRFELPNLSSNCQPKRIHEFNA